MAVALRYNLDYGRDHYKHPGLSGRCGIHKFVKFFLLRYKSGDPKYHDQEVNEARWVDIDEAHKMLAFASEKKVVLQAKDLIQSTN